MKTFVLLFGAAWALLALYMAALLWRATRTRWGTAEGVVTHWETSPYSTSNLTPLYRISITYKFSAGGKDFVSSRVNFFNKTGVMTMAEIVKRLGAAEPRHVAVFYDRDAPENSALENPVDWRWWVATPLAFMFAIAALWRAAYLQ